MISRRFFAYFCQFVSLFFSGISNVVPLCYAHTTLALPHTWPWVNLMLCVPKMHTILFVLFGDHSMCKPGSWCFRDCHLSPKTTLVFLLNTGCTASYTLSLLWFLDVVMTLCSGQWNMNSDNQVNLKSYTLKRADLPSFLKYFQEQSPIHSALLPYKEITLDFV